VSFIGETLAFEGATTAAITVIDSEAGVEPAAFVAVTVYVAAAVAVVGVPVITPVVVLSVRPAGSAGATAYEATAPPDDVGVFDAIAVPVT
jgi:hypothetical protein